MKILYCIFYLVMSVGYCFSMDDKFWHGVLAKNCVFNHQGTQFILGDLRGGGSIYDVSKTDELLYKIEPPADIDALAASQQSREHGDSRLTPSRTWINWQPLIWRKEHIISQSFDPKVEPSRIHFLESCYGKNPKNTKTIL